MEAASFFPVHSSAPPFALQPDDHALEQRISKLAEFAQKNGPPFVHMIRQKQADNPDYSFLSGGPGGEYFTWRLYCFLHNLDSSEPLQVYPGQAAPHQSSYSPSRRRESHKVANAHQELLHNLTTSAASLPAEVAAAFATVLGRLSGTRQSIKESKEWFVANASFAGGLAAKMAIHQHQLPSYDQQIHVIYLANDVLLKSLPQAAESQNADASIVSAAFQAALPLMIHSALTSGQSSAEVKQRLLTILDHWGARGVYSKQFVRNLQRIVEYGELHDNTVQSSIRNEATDGWPGGMDAHQPPALPPMHGSGPPVIGLPPWTPSSAVIGHQTDPRAPLLLPHSLQQWDQGLAGPIPQPLPGPSHPAPYHGPPMPPAAPPPGNLEPSPYGPGQPFLPGGQAPFHHPVVHPSTLPLPGWNAAAVAPFAADALMMPPPDVAASQEGEAPVDPMGFPPGLLPALVKEHLRTEESYEPLSRSDIERAGVPAAMTADAYLLARLDKFYAELQGYRSGMNRADLEDDQKRHRNSTALGEKPLSQPKAGHAEAQSDGSYRGEQRDGGPAGLGFGAAYHVTPDDPFSQYRKKRSGFYHESIARSSTAASGPQVVTEEQEKSSKQSGAHSFVGKAAEAIGLRDSTSRDQDTPGDPLSAGNSGASGDSTQKQSEPRI